METLQQEFGAKMNFGSRTGDELSLHNWFQNVLAFVVILRFGGGAGQIPVCVCVCVRDVSIAGRIC